MIIDKSACEVFYDAMSDLDLLKRCEFQESTEFNDPNVDTKEPVFNVGSEPQNAQSSTQLTYLLDNCESQYDPELEFARTLVLSTTTRSNTDFKFQLKLIRNVYNKTVFCERCKATYISSKASKSFEKKMFRVGKLYYSQKKRSSTKKYPPLTEYQLYCTRYYESNLAKRLFHKVVTKFKTLETEEIESEILIANMHLVEWESNKIFVRMFGLLVEHYDIDVNKSFDPNFFIFNKNGSKILRKLMNF